MRDLEWVGKRTERARPSDYSTDAERGVPLVLRSGRIAVRYLRQGRRVWGVS